MLGKLARMTLLGARLDLGARFGHLAQALLAPRQFVGDRHAIGNVGRVRRLGFGHQIGDFGLQLRLDLARMLIGKRAVPAGVGVDLRAVETNRAHLQHAHLARQQQNLNEQRLDLFEKPPPESRDRVVVGMFVGREETERHRVIVRPLQLAAQSPRPALPPPSGPRDERGCSRSWSRGVVLDEQPLWLANGSTSPPKFLPRPCYIHHRHAFRVTLPLMQKRKSVVF